MLAFLTFAVVVFLFTILVLIARANELSEVLTGKADNYDQKSKWNGYFLLAFLVLMFISIFYQFKILVPIMIPKSASYHGEATDSLFYTTLTVIGVVFTLTQIALFYFAYLYNQSRNKTAYFYTHNNTLEVVWTVIPSIVLAGLVAKGMLVWFSIFNVENRDKNMMVVEVTGKQFNWMIRYPGADGKFGKRIIDKEHITPTNELGIDWNDATSHDDFMADKLVFIKDKPVLVKLGAQDVLHSFYLPHFRVKMDCVPGIPTQFYFKPKFTTVEMQQYLSTLPWWNTINPETQQPRWKTFKYELACTELCGRSHYGMQKEVVVVANEAEYKEWMKTQQSYYETAVKPTLTSAVETTTETKESSVDVASITSKLNLAGVVANGIENKLIAFIEDKTKAVDKTTWFSFDRLLFETGKSTLKPESQEQLNNIALILKNYPEVDLKVGGYTDNVGDPKKNKALSDERAKSVVAELVKLGVEEKRLKAEGYGEEHPVADNKTEEGRAQNRRIDVRVTKKSAVLI
jgi:cytochrome c oxidase subunit 2